MIGASSILRGARAVGAWGPLGPGSGGGRTCNVPKRAVARVPCCLATLCYRLHPAAPAGRLPVGRH
jgi:hypothetical protein